MQNNSENTPATSNNATFVWPKELDVVLKAAGVIYNTHEIAYSDSELAQMLLLDLGYPQERVRKFDGKSIHDDLAFCLHLAHAWDNSRSKIIQKVIVVQTKLIHELVSGGK